MQTDKYIVPGLYAEIKDYQLISLETPQSLSENAIVLLGDLPDFVYVPDETSTNVDAIKKVRIVPNTILPITSADEAIRTLSGQNILDGILTQEQKEELICKDMISAIKLAAESATIGELAIVKIVKRDGTRPNTNSKYEIFQALENAYEKLGNVKCSQIVPIGIAGDEEFSLGEEKEPEMKITRPIVDGGVPQEHIFNDKYIFSPVKSTMGVKVEFEIENQEYFNHTANTEQSNLIKEKGIDSPEVQKLLTGKVLIDGKEVKTGVQLKYENEKLVIAEELSVTIVEKEAGIVLGVGTVFATVKVEDLNGKKVVSLTSENKPLLNFYATEVIVKAEVTECNITPTACKVGEEIQITGKLKEAVDSFAAQISGEGFEVVEEISLQADKVTFNGKVRATAEGEKKFKVVVAEPNVPFEKEFTVQVAAGETKVVARKAKAVKPESRAITTVYAIGQNQFVIIDIIKSSSNWIEVKNLGNLKEHVDKIFVLEGIKDGEEQYKVTVSGTCKVTFSESDVEGEMKATVEDLEEVIEPVSVSVKTKVSGWDIVLAEDTYITFNELTLVLKEGLMLVPEPKQEKTIYFDAKVDTVKAAEYLINYVPANSEVINSSLKYIQQQISSLSETLIVWGVKPPVDTESNTVNKYINNLINLPKFKKGFKVRTSASKEVDLGAFLSVVVGPIKVNNIGGITNFNSHKVVDFERENGGNGEVKPLTNKLFVETTNEFVQGTNVELKTYVGVKAKVMEAIVLSTKSVLGKTMITLDKDVDTSIFSLNGFEVMISNTDSKDRHGSFAALAFAMKANKERDRAPLQQDLNGIADINFSRKSLETLLKNKFTVISKNLISGKGVIVDTPTMTREDSDFQNRSSIGTLLVLLNKLRKVADTKKGKRFPKKEDKVMLEQDLKNVFVDELQRADSLITAYNFKADMRFLDNYGYLSAEFEIQDAKKLEKVKFAGGLARLNA